MNETALQFQFGADFSTLDRIPEDPRERSEYYKRFKTFLKASRDKIRAWHGQGAGGREVVQAYSGLIDETIKHVVVAIGDLEAFRGLKLTDRFALVAVGGYGRGELNPYSDIDLLFLLNKKMDKTLDGFIQEIVSVLWGIGLDIGHSCRTLKECQALAKEDATVRTSMIETRFLFGARNLYEKLWDAVYKNIFRKHAREYLGQSLKTFFAKGKEGVTSYPEPDVKNGPGGLRDYHVALWSVAMCFDGASLSEIGREDILNNEELQALKKSVNFLLRVRNELHYRVGKKADVLTRDVQMELAHNLGYGGDGHTGVERFMKDYFHHASQIHTISEAVSHRCLETRPLIHKVMTTLQQKKLGHGFFAYKSQLRVPDDSETLFSKDRTLLLTAFRLCLDHNLEPDAQLKRLIRLHKHRLDAEFIRGSEVREFLLNTLASPRASTLLRQMHEAGLLGRILPEFERSLFEVHYDFYHRYTSDEHALRMVRFLEELDSTQDANLEKLKRIYASAQNRVMLKLACLLQTFGNRPDDLNGATSGGGPLSDVVARLHLTPKQQDVLHFLVKHKNMMNELAFHHDIHHPPIIRDLGGLAERPDRLDLLFLISYADLKAVAPETWTEWKNILLTELYHRTRNFLLRPESLDEKPRTTRNAVYSQLADEMDHDTISRHLDSMPDDYFLTAASEDIIDHLRLLDTLGDRPFVMKTTYHDQGGFFNLVLCGPSDIHLFKNLIGTLTAKAMNILGAQIFARDDGRAVIIIQIAASEIHKLYGETPEVWEEVRANLESVLEGGMTLSELLRTRTRVHAKKEAGGIEPKIQIDNRPDDLFTLVRIEARDHPGMLYKIVYTLAQFGIELHRAKIATRGGRGIDMFSVSLRGGKILFQPLIQRIKDQIIQSLLVEKLEELA